MKLKITWALLFYIGVNAHAQIPFQNPSLDGAAGSTAVAPTNWDINQCATVDIQPGVWGVGTAPTNGNAYVGMGHDPNFPNIGDNWQEGVFQKLCNG